MVPSKRALAGRWRSSALAGFSQQAGHRPRAARGRRRLPGRAQFEVVVQKNVMIPMRDGVRLAADLYRPARDGKEAPGASRHS